MYPALSRLQDRFRSRLRQQRPTDPPVQTPFTLVLCVVTAAITMAAFRDPALFQRFLFQPERILAHKEWHRLVSHAFVHVDGPHAILNLLSLYLFGSELERVYGFQILLGVYFAAVLGGALLSLLIHRHHDYTAVGASAGVCGVLFAGIFVMPGMDVALWPLPVFIPGPVFALIYLTGTFLAIRRHAADGVAHDAHFGGAIVGLALALVINPAACASQSGLMTAAAVVAVGGLVILARGQIELTRLLATRAEADVPLPDYEPTDEARRRQAAREEINLILDKVGRSGMDSLSKAERAALDQHSARIRASRRS